MYVIGLMSGTSVDGIDAALVEIVEVEDDLQVKLLAGETYSYPLELREKILAAGEGLPLSMAEWVDLDEAIAHEFAQAALKIQALHPKAALIGSHGQTVFHRPPRQDKSLGYSVQLGKGYVIANKTGIITVSNFRAGDLAAQGQGAPLVPLVDAYLLGDRTKTRCIQNLGGIGNVTYLPSKNQPDWESGILGWDTGPGNTLIDLAVQEITHGKQTFDHNGSWAFRGKACEELVLMWLETEPFFQLPPPKSTGRELFGKNYYYKCKTIAAEFNLTEADWIATLSELSTAAIVKSYQQFLPLLPDEVLLCGGGAYNLYLKKRLQAKLDKSKIKTTEEVGLSAAFKEAIAFAVLAYWRYVCEKPGNLPQVTGAQARMLLGEIHRPIFCAES